MTIAIIEQLTHGVCMQITDSTSEGTILSCLLEEMHINQEVDGVIVSDKIINDKWDNLNDIYLFQAHPPPYIKTTLIAPGVCQYEVDIKYLSSEFQKLGD